MGVCVSGDNNRTPQNRTAQKNDRKIKHPVKTKEPAKEPITEKINKKEKVKSF